jgi:hypothetical protein
VLANDSGYSCITSLTVVHNEVVSGSEVTTAYQDHLQQTLQPVLDELQTLGASIDPTSALRSDIKRTANVFNVCLITWLSNVMAATAGRFMFRNGYNAEFRTDSLAQQYHSVTEDTITAQAAEPPLAFDHATSLAREYRLAASARRTELLLT